MIDERSALSQPCCSPDLDLVTDISTVQPDDKEVVVVVGQYITGCLSKLAISPQPVPNNKCLVISLQFSDPRKTDMGLV